MWEGKENLYIKSGEIAKHLDLVIIFVKILVIHFFMIHTMREKLEIKTNHIENS